LAGGRGADITRILMEYIVKITIFKLEDNLIGISNYIRLLYNSRKGNSYQELLLHSLLDVGLHQANSFWV
jgi:hypothetical protein